MIDRLGDDFFVLDPIMERAVGRIGSGGQAENSGNNIGVPASKKDVRGEEIEPGHSDGGRGGRSPYR